ncbi:MAG: methyltransferase domain-containing protein [Microcoleaceae cyanobacterium]
MTQTDYQIRFPESGSDLRNEEYFFLAQDGSEKTFTLQNYAEIYQIPLLYEKFCIKACYQSPETLAMLLVSQLIQAKIDIESLIILDIAAGSGLFGKNIAKYGVKSIVGVDIIPEAAQAAQRDYPGVYEKYYIEDLTNISPTAQQELDNRGFNCLVCCSSLSCHFPIQGFINSFNMIEPDGWIAFNVNTYILEDLENTESFEYKKAAEFGQLYHQMVKAGILEVTQKHYYLHRYLTNGKALDYVAITARKRGNIPENWA